MNIKVGSNDESVLAAGNKK